jgi:hypothetical protein
LSKFKYFFSTSFENINKIYGIVVFDQILKKQLINFNNSQITLIYFPGGFRKRISSRTKQSRIVAFTGFRDFYHKSWEREGEIRKCLAHHGCRTSQSGASRMGFRSKVGDGEPWPSLLQP